MMAPAYSLQHDQEYQMYKAMRQQAKAEEKARKQCQRELRAQLGLPEIEDQSGIIGKLGNVVSKIRGRKSTDNSGRKSALAQDTSKVNREGGSLFQGTGRTASPDRDLKQDGKAMDMKAALTEIELVRMLR